MNPPEGTWEQRRRQARKSEGMLRWMVTTCRRLLVGAGVGRKKRGSSALRRGAPARRQERPVENRRAAPLCATRCSLSSCANPQHPRAIDGQVVTIHRAFPRLFRACRRPLLPRALRRIHCSQLFPQTVPSSVCRSRSRAPIARHGSGFIVLLEWSRVKYLSGPESRSSPGNSVLSFSNPPLRL